MKVYIVRDPSLSACAVFYTDVAHMDMMGLRTMLYRRPELLHVIPPAGYYDIFVGGQDNKAVNVGKIYPIDWDAVYSPTEDLELVSLNTCKHRFQRHSSGLMIIFHAPHAEWCFLKLLNFE